MVLGLSHPIVLTRRENLTAHGNSGKTVGGMILDREITLADWFARLGTFLFSNRNDAACHGSPQTLDGGEHVLSIPAAAHPCPCSHICLCSHSFSIEKSRAILTKMASLAI